MSLVAPNAGKETRTHGARVIHTALEGRHEHLEKGQVQEAGVRENVLAQGLDQLHIQLLVPDMLVVGDVPTRQPARYTKNLEIARREDDVPGSSVLSPPHELVILIFFFKVPQETWSVPVMSASKLACEQTDTPVISPGEGAYLCGNRYSAVMAKSSRHVSSVSCRCVASAWQE
jgi:hypothetical protein